MSESFNVADASFLDSYSSLWAEHDANSLFRSPGYLRMIAELTGADLAFVVRARGGRPISALPFALKQGAAGKVINSLPYFGSCSGIVGARGDDEAPPMVRALLEHARQAGVAAVTLVDDWRRNIFGGLVDADFVSQRSNQYIDLKAMSAGPRMHSYHQKTRNLVRKAEKLGVACRISDDPRDIDALADKHRQNMANVGGIAKPEGFFAMLRDAARPLGRQVLYVATFQGRDCAYLLNFYCGDTVEYYMPAVSVEDRNAQPLSLLIDRAINDAVREGYARWNFGGTWPTQHSLRHFKVRWGSSETSYGYYSYILDRGILRATAAELLAAFPYFFVAPFDQLADQSARSVA